MDFAAIERGIRFQRVRILCSASVGDQELNARTGPTRAAIRRHDRRLLLRNRNALRQSATLSVLSSGAAGRKITMRQIQP